MWYWQRDRHTDHWNDIQNPGIDSHKYAWNDIQNPGIDSHKYAQFLTKGKEQFNGGKNSLFNKQYWSNWTITNEKQPPPSQSMSYTLYKN